MGAPDCINLLYSFIKSYLFLASPQTSFGVRLSRIHFSFFFVASCEDVMKMEPPVFNE